MRRVSRHCGVEVDDAGRITRASRGAPGPHPIPRCGVWGVGRSRVLTVGVQFGVWSHIAAGATTVAAIARRAQASERGIRMLLDALVGLQLLTKAQDTYALTPVAAEFLVRDRPFY